MDTTLILARIIAILFVVAGISMLLNGSFFIKALKDIKKNQLLLIYGGMINLVLGMLMVTYHNLWLDDPITIFVSVVSWLVLIKGISLLVLPEQMMSIAEKVGKHKSVTVYAGVFYALLGLLLAVYAF